MSPSSRNPEPDPNPTSGPWGVRTSLSHPLRIDAVAASPAGGLIGITFCPGKCGASLYGPRWQRDLALDLDAVKLWGAAAVVTLIEDHELELLGVRTLGVQVQARRLAWCHLPIADVSAPDARFETSWAAVGPQLLATLSSGGRVLVHCRGGLGRAGTVAARLLVELGVPPREAIARVRQARPGAIETGAQQRYVLGLRQMQRPWGAEKGVVLRDTTQCSAMQRNAAQCSAIKTINHKGK